jgi:hypothetical protein
MVIKAFGESLSYDLVTLRLTSSLKLWLGLHLRGIAAFNQFSINLHRKPSETIEHTSIINHRVHRSFQLQIFMVQFWSLHSFLNSNPHQIRFNCHRNPFKSPQLQINFASLPVLPRTAIHSCSSNLLHFNLPHWSSHLNDLSFQMPYLSNDSAHREKKRDWRLKTF